MLAYDLLLGNEAGMCHDVLSRRRVEDILRPKILDGIPFKHLDRVMPPVLPLRDTHIFFLVQLNLDHNHYVLQWEGERLRF